MSNERNLILVGLDSSPAGSAALRWAMDKAVASGTRLLAVQIRDRAEGPDAGRLAAMARRASLIVLGRSRAGRHAGLSSELASVCGCPVVVVDESGAAQDAAVRPRVLLDGGSNTHTSLLRGQHRPAPRESNG